MTGQTFEFSSADAMGYHRETLWLLDLINANQLNVYLAYIKGNYSDMGYVSYLALVYTISWKSILFARLLKAIMSAYMCVLVYKIAERNFGEPTAKIAGIITMLFPNLIYYCGLHLKETEMIFLTVLFVERADFLIREKKFNIPLLFITITIGLSLFLFRTVLGATALLSLVIGFIFLSSGKFEFAKKVFFMIFVISFFFFFRGGEIESEIVGYWNARDTNQRVSMQARANLENGNDLSKYGTTAIFAPFMLVLPFPTLVNVSTQQNQMMINGGYFIKNAFSFFVLLALFFIYQRRTFQEHTIILSLLISYLGVIAMSKFAISERFHLPILPLIIILGSYGITLVNKKNKKYYIPYLFFIALVIIGWNVFKLAGRDNF
jgi:hypothetical protein